MTLVTPRVGALGFDTVTPLNATSASQLKNAGMSFAVRYLGSLSKDEVGIIQRAGLAVSPVTFSRAPGFIPSAAMGTADGNEAVAQLRALAMPPGVTVWRDLEGPGGHAQDVIDWVNAWAAPIKKAGYDAGLYVGYGTLLTSRELYHALNVDRYWHSLSRVTDSSGALAEPDCGWCMHQLYPTTQVVGYAVDVNVVQQDYQGRMPTFAG